MTAWPPPPLPPVMLAPPDILRGLIVCELERRPRFHNYEGKDPGYAAGYLVLLRLRFRCEYCGKVRHWGNEEAYTKTIEYQSYLEHLTDKALRAELEADL